MDDERGGPTYLTVDEARRLAGVSRQTVHNWIRAGDVEGHREVSGSGGYIWRVSRDSLERKMGHREDVSSGRQLDIPDEQFQRLAQELTSEIAKSASKDFRGYLDEIGHTHERLGEYRARAEASECALKKVGERLDAEREARLEAERELARLRAEQERPGFWARLFGSSS